MGCGNLIGPEVCRLRIQRNWTQDQLATKLQCLGYDISRETVAKIECGIRKVSDDWIAGFLKVFEVPIAQLFPLEIRKLDSQYAKPAPPD
jgi:transcriptional regulator with XRE-family HTH domain